MCCESFDVVRFDLGPLLQGQMRIAKPRVASRTRFPLIRLQTRIFLESAMTKLYENA